MPGDDGVSHVIALNEMLHLILRIEAVYSYVNVHQCKQEASVAAPGFVYYIVVVNPGA